MIKLEVLGKPITKKNSQQIVTNKVGRPFVIPSKQFKQYQKLFLSQVKYKGEPINKPVNVKCVYFMPTRHKVDITNLLNATHDLLVDAKIIEDDNSKIVVSVDGSRVLYDKDNPRVEIEIEEV